MGLLQKAVETYDCHSSYVGQYRTDHEVLAPISHLVTRAALEITLDAMGHFCAAAAVDKSEPKILIPVTENSAGRSGTTICAHPLCDQLGYLAPYNKEKNQNYIDQLSQWEVSDFSHPMLRPILLYVQSGTILQDLSRCDLIQLKENGTPVDEKLLVRWRVLGVAQEDACWRNTELFQAFIGYCQVISQEERQDICMLTGKKVQSAKQHPKGIVSFNGNAKLISANDKTGFTYRGRFSQDWQAATVGYEASQKAHNALRWLVSEQGENCGGRTFICWNPKGHQTCKATGAWMQLGKTVTNPTDYRTELRKTLQGYQSQLPEQEDVVIAAFDAATSGRLSLTYYNELKGSDFLQRLYEWDLHCSWPSRYGIQSPSLWQIIQCAFGTQKVEKNQVKLEVDESLLRQQMQRLVSCRIDCARMPSDIVLALMHKASAPQAGSEKEQRQRLKEKILATACAVIRKYRYDTYKEDWAMTLEPEKQDISYQYGRLLAVLEKVERDTYNGETDREPNAIRQQSVFCQRPMYAAANIEKQLERAYFPRLKPSSRIYYKNLIGQIMAEINQYPQQQWNKPLKETYLMGYYLQRNALYTKKTTDTEETENG